MTGVLPILLGRATRLADLVAGESKEYVGVLYLHDRVDVSDLRRILSEFIGPIYQRPPVKSAVSRRLRVRRIFSMEVLDEIDGRYFLIRAEVEAGTYIRKLFYDIGEVMGVGGSMRELRRVRVGDIGEKELVTLQDLRRAVRIWREDGNEDLLRKVVRPVEEVLPDLPVMVVKDTAVESVVHGASLKVRGVAMLSPGISPGQRVLLKTLKGEVIGTARASRRTKEVLTLERGVAAVPERIIMERGIYPRVWPKGSGGEERKSL